MGLDWLHGWPRIGDRVDIGASSLCAGCGRFRGTFCAAMDDEYIEWAKDRPHPDWPFPEDDCPVCDRGSEGITLAERIVQELAEPGDVAKLARLRREAREWVAGVGVLSLPTGQ